GANKLADAMDANDGVVMWRAFVYSNEVPTDRVRQAYDEFTPQDGAFRANVLIQVKNGPVDFQPREPFHPLFGAMPRTPLALEVQVTKEYLGFATHLAYLGTAWEEVLKSDTFRPRAGTPVADTIVAMAGVAHDRTASGSNAVAQYAPEAAARFGNLATVPDAYLLWFHHVPWDHRTRSGATVWRALVERYDRGVAAVDSTLGEWRRLAPLVDPER